MTSSTTQRSTSQLLPWMVPITDGIVACKDSSLLAAFEFTGVDADSVGESEIYVVAEAAERLMAALRDLPVTVWWTLRRERAVDYPGEPMPNGISQMIDDEHRAAFHGESAFVNRHFFSIVWMPERSTSGLFAKVGAQMAEGVSMFSAAKLAVQSTYLGKHAFAWRAAEIEQVTAEYENRLAQVAGIMSALNCRRLFGSEMLGFLWAQANPGRRMSPKNWNGESFFDALLSEEPITVSRDSLRFGDSADAHHVGVLSMKSWPSALQFGALVNLVSMPTEMVISNVFRVLSTPEADKIMSRRKAAYDMLKYPLQTLLFGALLKKGEMNESKADPFLAQASVETMEAKGQMSSGRMIFGYHNLSVAVIDRDYSRLEGSIGEMKRQLEGGGFVGAIRESIHTLSAWATTLPGQWQECRRWMMLSSQNVVDMAPLTGVVAGQRYNAHMSEQLNKRTQALTVLATDQNTPYYFNFHEGALAHCMVVGPSRAGKSIGMNFLISQFQKYNENARTIIFDKDFSCRIPTLLQGGEHLDLRAGAGVSINPMHLVSDQSAWPFLASWVETLIASRGYTVTAQDAGEINRAIRETAEREDPALHRLYTVATLLPGQLAVHLDEWVEGGAFAAYTDNEQDNMGLSDLLAIEMGEVMKDPRLAQAIVDYLFFLIQRDLEAQRKGGVRKITMIYLEEFWYLIENERFAKKLKDWLKTLAKFDAFVVMTTQSIEDLAGLPLTTFAALRDAVLTKIFLPNVMARTADLSEFYRTKMGLRQDQVELIASGVPKQDYLIIKPEVSRRVRLRLTPRQVAALRSETSAQRTFNPIYQRREPGWQMEYIEAMTGGVRQ